MQSLEAYSDQPVAWSTLWSAAMGLHLGYLLIGFGIVFLFVMLFGFFLPIMAFIVFAFLRPLQRKRRQQTQPVVNRLLNLVHAWMMNNQR